jgi:DNA-binding NarL/FixJ family response regulator
MQKILLVDDHRMFADGIRFLLERSGEYAIAGVLHRGREVMPALAATPVNLLILDIDLPDISGFDLAQSVRKAYPTLPILALSMLNDTHSIRRMLDAGATGYCIKSAGADELFAALRRVSTHDIYLPPTYLNQLRAQRSGQENTGLTDRETEVVRLITSGQSTKQIANQLFLSTRTVETHRKNIYRKADVHTNVELAHYARQHQLL